MLTRPFERFLKRLVCFFYYASCVTEQRLKVAGLAFFGQSDLEIKL
jgi:hypothetical protein